MCQVHADAYVSSLTPGETNYSDCHPRKTTTCILHVVSITTHTHDRRESIGEEKQRKEKKIKERKEKRRKRYIIASSATTILLAVVVCCQEISTAASIEAHLL